jgi:hypothetical protein
MAAIAVGERKNGGALIVVRIVLPSGFDPADYSVFQALFGMIFLPRVRGAVNGLRRGVKRPRWPCQRLGLNEQMFGVNEQIPGRGESD